MSRPPRAVVRLAGLLAVVCLLALAASRLYAPERVLDLTPGADYVAAPTPPERARSAGQLVEQRWLTRTARATGIPVPALRAYADAQLADPGCRVGWTTLAGIGWVESQHGTLGGRTLGADGRSSSTILGPALDGSGGFAAIRATGGSARWHGDTVWEHAVGPMQFLPTTWEPWGADGDGDGAADPRDLDDAALGAARYLCAAGEDLTGLETWEAAVLTYNPSREYVDAVHAAASAYARAAGA